MKKYLITWLVFIMAFIGYGKNIDRFDPIDTYQPIAVDTALLTHDLNDFQYDIIIVGFSVENYGHFFYFRACVVIGMYKDPFTGRTTLTSETTTL